MSYTNLRLMEDSEEPSERFLKVYGNYCGPGHKGGAPIDGLDMACMKHDKCYTKDGYHDCNCDAEFIKDIESFLQNGKLTFKQRTFGTMIKAFFKRIKPCDSN